MCYFNIHHPTQFPSRAVAWFSFFFFPPISRAFYQAQLRTLQGFHNIKTAWYEHKRAADQRLRAGGFPQRQFFFLFFISEQVSFEMRLGDTMQKGCTQQRFSAASEEVVRFIDFFGEEVLCLYWWQILCNHASAYTYACNPLYKLPPLCSIFDTIWTHFIFS